MTSACGMPSSPGWTSGEPEQVDRSTLVDRHECVEYRSDEHAAPIVRFSGIGQELDRAAFIACFRAQRIHCEAECPVPPRCRSKLVGKPR